MYKKRWIRTILCSIKTSNSLMKTCKILFRSIVSFLQIRGEDYQINFSNLVILLLLFKNSWMINLQSNYLKWTESSSTKCQSSSYTVWPQKSTLLTQWYNRHLFRFWLEITKIFWCEWIISFTLALNIDRKNIVENSL